MTPATLTLATGAAIILLAGWAHSADRHSFGHGLSDVTILPTDRPGALAEIRFNNTATDPTMTQTFALTLDGLTVEITGTIGTSISVPDEIHITPPDGVMCAPSCHLVIPDGTVGSVWLYSTEGLAS